VEVHPLEAAGRARWNAFVESHPDGTFFHLAEWARVIEGGLRHKTHYLWAGEPGAVRGVLPLARVKSFLFGDALVSTPFCVYGGILATDDEAAAALTREACRLADRLGVDYLELRGRRRDHPDWPCKDELYVTFRKTLHPDHEQNLKAIPRKQRAMVRKGIKNDLGTELDPDTRRFFSIYSESVRNLGTPVFPPKLFSELRRQFGERCEVLTVTKDGNALASVLSFFFRDEVLPYYGGGTDEARRWAANDFLYC
jgi:FemAB-related protein (PEP-CTERM system-associated)